MRFSRTELVQLAVAILALSTAFTIVILNPLYSNALTTGSPVVTIAVAFLAALLSVGTGVGLHEIMHKVVAQRYGYWAEFRYSLRGLLFTFMFAALGFLFGAPGATYIAGAVTREQNGTISAAGPLTNIGLGSLFFALTVLLGPFTEAGSVVGLAATINFVLAAFNMIPFMPLDGAKVFRWNIAAWVGILALDLGIFVFGILKGFLSW